MRPTAKCRLLLPHLTIDRSSHVETSWHPHPAAKAAATAEKDPIFRLRKTSPPISHDFCLLDTLGLTHSLRFDLSWLSPEVELLRELSSGFTQNKAHSLHYRFSESSSHIRSQVSRTRASVTCLLFFFGARTTIKGSANSHGCRHHQVSLTSPSHLPSPKSCDYFSKQNDKPQLPPMK